MSAKKASKARRPAKGAQAPVQEGSTLKRFWNWYKARRKKKKEERKKPQTFGEALWSWTKTLVGAFIVVMIINGLAIASFVVPTGSMENTVMTGDFLFVNKFIYGPSTPQVIPFANVPLPYYKLPPLKDPERGDVIVFIYPGHRDHVESEEFQYFLKRCVAVSGDTLEIVDNKLFINGRPSPPPEHSKFVEDGHYSIQRDKMQSFPYGRNYTKYNYGPVIVPKEGDVINLTKDNFREWDTFIRREGHEFAMRAGRFYIDDVETNTYTVERNYVFGMGDNRLNSSDSRYWGFVPVDNVVGTPIIVYWSWDTDLPISQIFKKFASVRWGRIGKVID